jgi:hypothetical protein
MRGRVWKEKVTTVETVAQVHAVGKKGVGSATSEEGVQELSKGNFEVGSWQFQVLERHESNDLNSYTVAELRQLLRCDFFSSLPGFLDVRVESFGFGSDVRLFSMLAL